jgi:hypothetical protein
MTGKAIIHSEQRCGLDREGYNETKYDIKFEKSPPNSFLVDWA